jgi:Concanavalin A-like lectin/glucanases superfamily/Glycosyl hydrolases family 43
VSHYHIDRGGPGYGQLDRRRFLTSAGALTAGAVVSARLGGDVSTAADAHAVLSDPVFTANGNPVITDIYTADPDAFVHDGRLYLDLDHDEAPLGVFDFVMREWRVYSTDDLVHFTDHGVRMTLADFAWADRNAWAPQMIHRDGTFFWYVPARKDADNSMAIGVAVGDSPLGPFRDALGHPLIDNTVANHSAFDIDPTVFVDDDGQAYIYWGSFSSPRAAKLKRNMIEIDELDGGGGGATGPRVPGRLGNAVKLNGVADYVSLPSGIVSGLNDFTISVWVNPAAISTWSRVFDFGTGTAVNMFLTVNAGAGPRFAITIGGGGAEQRLSRSGQLPLNAWSHLAVTLSGTTGTLYVNGVPAATNPVMTLRPSDLGVTANNWIGRSQYPDPFLNATVDEFQIYDRALNATEIQQLAAGEPGAGTVASYRFDEDGGADALDSSGNGRTATIISPPVNVITPQGLTGYWEAPYLFKRNGTYYLAYARGNPRTGGNPATIDYATATDPLGPWTYRGRILDTVNNTTTNHAAIVEFKNQWFIVYHNGMLPGGGEFRRSVCIDRLRFNDDGTIQPVIQTLSSHARKPVARYTFDESGGAAVVDQTGNGWDATLVGGATRAPGVNGNAVRLSGDGQYAALPAGILWNMYDFTLAAWVWLDSPGAAQHLFDFGTGPTSNMYLTPLGGAGVARFAITTNGPNAEQRIDGTTPLPVAEWVHVAVTKSALVGTLYVNGVQAGQNPNVGLYPARLGNTANNWIGRSQNPAEPYFSGLVDDFRIYQRGLTATEIGELVQVS